MIEVESCGVGASGEQPTLPIGCIGKPQITRRVDHCKPLIAELHRLEWICRGPCKSALKYLSILNLLDSTRQPPMAPETMHIPEPLCDFLDPVQAALRRYDAQLKDINHKVCNQHGQAAIALTASDLVEPGTRLCRASGPRSHLRSL